MRVAVVLRDETSSRRGFEGGIYKLGYEREGFLIKLGKKESEIMVISDEWHVTHYCPQGVGVDLNVGGYVVGSMHWGERIFKSEDQLDFGDAYSNESEV